MYAANDVRDNQNMHSTNWHGENNQNSSMANATMMNNEDDMSVGTTQSADTVKRSNCSNIMPTMRSMMTRGAAWNIIKERNWVQQTIADRDKRWCPANIERNLSPADRVGAIDPAQFGKLLDSRNELTTAMADSGCTATICIPGTPMKNIRPTKNPIRLKAAQGSWLETTHEGEIDIPGLPEAARKAHICPDLANLSLISIKTLVDAGCEVLFSKYDCVVLYKGSIVWKGGRQASKGL